MFMWPGGDCRRARSCPMLPAYGQPLLVLTRLLLLLLLQAVGLGNAAVRFEDAAPDAGYSDVVGIAGEFLDALYGQGGQASPVNPTKGAFR